MLFLLVVLCSIVLAIVGVTWANLRTASANVGGVDFYLQMVPAHAWAANGTSPYSDTVAQKVYQLAQGREPIPASKARQFAFLSPLYSMAFLAPFGVADAIPARALWMTLTEICLVVSAILAMRLTGWKVSWMGSGVVFLFVLIGYYGARNVIQGSFSAIGAVPLLAGLLLVQSKRDMDAGLVLILATVDLHLSVPLIIFTILWALSVGRGRIVAGMLIGLLFMTISAMIFMPDWPIQWLRAMYENLPILLSRTSVMTVLANQLPGISYSLGLVFYGLAGLYLIAEWILAWGRDERWFQWTALMTLVIGLVFPLRTTSTDFVVLLPVLFLLFNSWQERWGPAGQRAAWVAVFILFVGGWALFLVTVNGARENSIMMILPPFLCLACLWWVRWWAIHRQRMFFEEYRV